MSHDSGELNIDPEELELFTSYNGIVGALRNESDRAVAILAASFLEMQLELALRRVMVEGVDVDELFKAYAPLSTFSGKIHVAHAFGLTSPNSHRNFGFVRKIRNHFAHHPGVTSFDVPPVRDWILQLTVSSAIDASDADTPRGHYLNGTICLMNDLWINSKGMARATLPRF